MAALSGLVKRLREKGYVRVEPCVQDDRRKLLFGTEKGQRMRDSLEGTIRYLQEQHALETLPEVLQQAAAKRLQYPDLSLTALCGCFDPAVSKSGLSHRMKKLEALAENLRQRQQEGQEAVQ